MKSFLIASLITSTLSAGCGLFVFVMGPRKPVNRRWALTCFAIFLWSLGLGMETSASSFPVAYRWALFQYTGCIFIPVLFLDFVLSVVGRHSTRILRGSYFLGLLLQGLSLTGHLETVKPLPPYRFFSAPKPLYFIYVVYFFALVIYAHWLTFRSMKRAEGRTRTHLQYILVAMGIGFTGGSTTFFLVYGVPIPPYGVYGVPLYLLVIGYAIFRHQLMDISVVVKRTLIYSVVSATLAGVYVGVVTVLAQIMDRWYGASTNNPFSP